MINRITINFNCKQRTNWRAKKKNNLRIHFASYALIDPIPWKRRLQLTIAFWTKLFFGFDPTNHNNFWVVRLTKFSARLFSRRSRAWEKRQKRKHFGWNFDELITAQLSAADTCLLSTRHKQPHGQPNFKGWTYQCSAFFDETEPPIHAPTANVLWF